MMAPKIRYVEPYTRTRYFHREDVLEFLRAAGDGRPYTPKPVFIFWLGQKEEEYQTEDE